MARRSSVAIGPASSIGRPSTFMMRPTVASPTGTEIGAQNGAICHIAEMHGLAVPTHRTMVELYGNTNIGQTLPGFTRVDMMAGYIHKHWSGTLAVSNLFNKQYWRSSSMPGEPRAFTARLSYRF